MKPVKISPDGDVGSRDLVDSIHGSGHYTWRTTSGKWLTDAEVEGWTDLQPGPAVLVEVVKVGALFHVDVNGKPAARQVASLIAGEFAVQAALQADGPVMLIARSDTTVVELGPFKVPLKVVGDNPASGG